MIGWPHKFTRHDNWQERVMRTALLFQILECDVTDNHLLAYDLRLSKSQEPGNFIPASALGCIGSVCSLPNSGMC